MNKLNILDRQMLVTFLIRGASIFFQSLQVILLIRFYGPADYGVFAICLSIFSFAMVIGRMGSDHYSLKECNSHRSADYQVCIRLSFIIIIPVLVATLISFAVVAMFYPPVVANSFVFFCLSSIFFGCSWNQLFILRALDEINWSIFLQTILNPFLLICFGYLFQNKSAGLSISFLFASCVTAIITFFLLRRAARIISERESKKISVKSAILNSRSFYKISIFEALQSLADSLVVGFFLIPSQVTVYSIFTRLGTFIMFPATITMIYGNNIAARWADIGMAKILVKLKRIRIVDTLASSLILFFILFGVPFLEFVFDIVFTQQEVIVLWIMSIAFLFDSITNFARTAVLMGGHEKELARIFIYLLPPYLFALAFLGSCYGLIGIAISFTVFRVSAKIWLLLIVKRLCGLEHIAIDYR
jgi:O-antigen/teichoic acid export membrane protein